MFESSESIQSATELPDELPEIGITKKEAVCSYHKGNWTQLPLRDHTILAAHAVTLTSF